jgi:amino acid transporter
VVLNWLVSITSASFFTNWAVIALTSFHFHSALRAQNLNLFAEQYTWSSALWPLAPILSLAVSLILLISLLICAIAPVGGTITAANFFSYTIGLLLIAVSTLGYKILFRTKWVKSEDADLVTGRRQLSEQEMVMLREYYSSSLWRRALSYLKL